LPARYVPPSGFGYPPGGFLPPGPCPPYFRRTALLGFTLRSVPLSKGLPARYHRAAPTYRFLSALRPAEAAGSLCRAAVPGLRPSRESLVRTVCLARLALAAPLGFSLPGCSGQSPFAGFRPRSSHALPGRKTAAQRPTAPRSLDRRQPGSKRLMLRGITGEGATPLGFLHRLNPGHSGNRRSGYEFTSRRAMHRCRPPDAP
jgi:hypothetical protein